MGHAEGSNVMPYTGEKEQERKPDPPTGCCRNSESGNNPIGKSNCKERNRQNQYEYQQYHYGLTPLTRQ